MTAFVDTQSIKTVAGVSTASEHNKVAVKSLQEPVGDYKNMEIIFADGAFKRRAPFDRKGTVEWKVVNKNQGLLKSCLSVR